MWKKTLKRPLDRKKPVKKMWIFTLSTVIMWICSGCSGQNLEKESISSLESEIIYEESTLSTEIFTNVDETVGITEDIKKDEEKNPENTVDNVDSTEETVDENQYYFVYYSKMYKVLTKKEVGKYIEKEYLSAYKYIKKEKLEDYFSEIKWIDRNGEISLSLYPKDILFPENNISEYLWMARCMNAFTLIENKYSMDEKWDNPDSLKPQFHCHAIYARDEKMPWNIEPFREETDFLKVLLMKGNP